MTQFKQHRRRCGETSRGILLAAVLLLAAVTGSCGKKTEGSAGGKPPAVPVHAAEVTQRDMPVVLDSIGAGEAYSTVNVKSQVTGEIVDVTFREGDIVQEGQVLFTIDQRPFKVALHEAEANLARAEAELEHAKAMVERDKAEADNAKTELDRDTTLLDRGTISQEEFDQTRTNADSMQASVHADEAAVKSSSESIRVARSAIDDAKLQLDYCTIRSPLTGRTGSLLIHKGNLVKANDTEPLVVINETRPIYVNFTLPEAALSAVRKAMAAGRLEVRAEIPGEEADPVVGNVTFVDNAVNQDTGTIRLKASFPNEDDRLWPGQYVSVFVRVATIPNAVVAPTQAIQMGQDGAYAYIVKADKTVELREVTVGDTYEGDSIIEKGLNPGETVVTDGQMRLAPGLTADILPDDAEGAASSS